MSCAANHAPGYTSDSCVNEDSEVCRHAFAKYVFDFDDTMEWKASQEERERVGRFGEWKLLR